MCRYQFVTPLTSLVVVKPDTTENGEFGEADRFNKIGQVKVRYVQHGQVKTLCPNKWSAGAMGE